MSTVEEQVAEVAPKADEAAQKGWNGKCIHCSKGVFFVKHTHALQQGHIYSELGAKEFKMSSLCEFCFDEVTRELDDEEAQT